MTRGILIAGNESPAAAAIAAEAKRRVKVAATAIIPNRFAEDADASPQPEGDEGALVWNPSGPVSARTLVTAAGNRLGRVDEAILVCTPPAVRRRPDELPPADIDALIDDLAKGWFFLVREIALLFRGRKAGTLALVLSEAGLGGGKDDAPDLIGASLAASFRSFAQGLLAASFAEPYRVLAFSSSEAGEDAAFAAFVFKILDEANKKNTGKWHKFGRGGLFGLR